MLRPKRVLAVIAVACASALISSSCGGSGADNSGAGGAEEVGDPVAGGSLDVIQMGEPRSWIRLHCRIPLRISRHWATHSTAR